MVNENISCSVKSIDVKVEEDTSADNELVHSSRETVSYLVIGGEDPLTAVTTSIPDGLTRSLTADVGETGRVHDVDVRLELVHTNIEDLDIFLEGPDGTTVELLTDVAADGDRLSATILDDESVQSITSGTAPYTGRFQPKGRLLDFAGKDIHGTWTLHVTDDTVGTSRGALLRWSLDILLASEPPGNLNQDENTDATDIDILFANLGSDNREFDLDGDGDVNTRDVDRLVLNIMGKRYGNADLDQDVDMTDVHAAVNNYDPLGQNSFHSWVQGNFDGDNDVDISDVMWIVRNYVPFGYNPVRTTAPATTVTNVGSSHIAARTASTDLRGAEQASASPASSRDGMRRENMRSLTGNRALHSENHSTDEQLFVDHYFRSVRRRPARVKLYPT